MPQFDAVTDTNAMRSCAPRCPSLDRLDGIAKQEVFDEVVRGRSADERQALTSSRRTSTEIGWPQAPP
jgi:hypothetical protein